MTFFLTVAVLGAQLIYYPLVKSGKTYAAQKFYKEHLDSLYDLCDLWYWNNPGIAAPDFLADNDESDDDDYDPDY